MSSWAFAFPVVRGMEKASRDLAEEVSKRHDEFVRSRTRAGVTMERVYEIDTLMGTFNIVYGEGKGFLHAMETFRSSTDPFDEMMLGAVSEVTGLDIARGPLPPAPEQVLQYIDPDMTHRGPGLAFCIPVAEDKVIPLIAYLKDVEGKRMYEMMQSRREKHIARECAYLQATPDGPVLCVYLEADDPVLANKNFATSDDAFDVWFKDHIGGLLGMDLNVPLPPIQTLHDWHV